MTFNLSDRIYPADKREHDFINVRSVKEFIRLLKLNFCEDNIIGHEMNENIINELAGDKLI